MGGGGQRLRAAWGEGARRRYARPVAPGMGLRRARAARSAKEHRACQGKNLYWGAGRQPKTCTCPPGRPSDPEANLGPTSPLIAPPEVPSFLLLTSWSKTCQHSALSWAKEAGPACPASSGACPRTAGIVQSTETSMTPRTSRAMAEGACRPVDRQSIARVRSALRLGIAALQRNLRLPSVNRGGVPVNGKWDTIGRTPRP
jgi:hypothetical protein